MEHYAAAALRGMRYSKPNCSVLVELIFFSFGSTELFGFDIMERFSFARTKLLVLCRTKQNISVLIGKKCSILVAPSYSGLDVLFIRANLFCFVINVRVYCPTSIFPPCVRLLSLTMSDTVPECLGWSKVGARSQEPPPVAPRGSVMVYQTTDRWSYCSYFTAASSADTKS